MSFNLFGPATICDIKVGYISTDRGYVEGINRYEANKYAQLNPGTQFIFKNRDLIRYLNINEVNRLTEDDLLPKTIPTSGCDDSSKNKFGLDIYNPDGSLKPDATGTPGIPRVYINGGGGVGAVANPIIGNDGSLLAIDLIDGGYGYRFAPQVNIVDLDGVGAGAVAIASLCPPNKVGTLQTFESEDDFEEYDFSRCAPEIADFGRRFGADGEDIGEWDPYLYASLKIDPIRGEIDAYQKFLSSLRNGWWNTRKATPVRIIGNDKKNTSKFDVQHWKWGGSREVNKISNKKENFKEVEFRVFTQGGGKADKGLMFTFIEKDGDHKFKIKADSFKERKKNKVKIKISPNSVYTVRASGEFKGEGVEQGLLKNFGAEAKELDKKFTDGSKIFADFTASTNDNDDLQIEATQGKFKTDNKRQLNGHTTYDLTYQLEDSSQFRVDTKVVKKIDDSFMNSYAVSPVPPSNVPGSDFAGIQYSFVYEENFPYDGEYIFKAMADNVGEVYLDNESLFQLRGFQGAPKTVKKNVKAGVHKIRCDVTNRQRFEKIEPPPQLSPQPSAPTVSPVGAGELLIDYRGMSPGSGLKRKSNTLVGIDDNIGNGFDTNATFDIKSSTVNARFSENGKKLLYDGSGTITIEMTYDDSGSISGLAITDIEVGGTVWERKFDTVLSDEEENEPRTLEKRYRQNGSVKKTIKVTGPKTSSQSSGTKPERPSGKSTTSTGDKPEVVFNTLDYINKADRKLWRINPNAGRDSNFINRYGVLPFDPTAVEREEVKVEVPQPKPAASIVKDGSELFLKVTGGGRIKVDFKLKVDDSLSISGVFAKEIIIKTDDNDLKLQRDIRELFDDDGDGGNYSGSSKETITGSGTFTGGKTYPIKVIGSSPTTGFKPIDKTTVGFDDNIVNGYDQNGLLNITNIRILEELEPRYVTKQNAVGKVVSRYPKKPNASTDSYAGIHIIRWESIDFPVDGNYTISTMVDDNAKIYIGNRDGIGRKAIGNGLRNVGRGGDEVVIEKTGFTQGSSTGRSIDTRFFKKGKYRIRVELEQIPGKPLAEGNPMAVAIQIKSPTPEIQKVLSRKSWNQNPMGVALTIDPPLPPIPQEPVPRAPGRCPNNPIWSSRFSDGDKNWWPVTHSAPNGTKTWSKFMNRFAISPVPPLSTKGSAYGGIIFTNSWNVEIPYDGFYGMKGTVDNGGRVLIDGKIILQGGYFSESSFGGSRKTLERFGSEKPQTVKFPLTKGNHTVTVEVENRPQTKQKRIKKTIFNTADWVVEQIPPPAAVVTPVVKQCETLIVYKGLHPRNKKIKVSSDKKRIDFSDADGKFNDSSFTIKSGDAVFSNDGKKLIGKKATLEFKYDDNPFTDGEAINSISIGKISWNKKQNPGSLYKTAKEAYDAGDISGLSDFSKDIITETRWRSNESLLVEPGLYKQSKGVFDRVSEGGTSYWQVDKDDDEQGFVPLGRPNVVRSGKETKVVDICEESGKVPETSNQPNQPNQPKRIQKGKKLIDGVRYKGPKLTSYRSGTLGPFLTPMFIDEQDYLANFNGTTWTMKWTNVDFPVSGRYRIRSEADDILSVKIDGAFISEARFRDKVKEINFSASEGSRTIEMELTNKDLQRGFASNPTVFNVIIDIDDKILIPADRPWTVNPIGISAILIPPPCPLETKGLGKVCDIVPLDPGNGYVAPPGPGYPAVLEIIKLIPTNPGINYGPNDAVCIIKEDGTKVCFPPNLDTFGVNLPIDVLTPSSPGGPPPLGISITNYPNIFQSSPTGVNARFRPVIRVRRDPLDVDPDQILQVTDLVGLKRTGYVNGREYFGAVFYKNGVRLAGYYETPGQLIQVYDTLQESIDGVVTTRPSAILRQGTDISSNDPRLNIPGTPDSIT